MVRRIIAWRPKEPEPDKDEQIVLHQEIMTRRSMSPKGSNKEAIKEIKKEIKDKGVKEENKDESKESSKDEITKVNNKCYQNRVYTNADMASWSKTEVPTNVKVRMEVEFTIQAWPSDRIEHLKRHVANRFNGFKMRTGSMKVVNELGEHLTMNQQVPKKVGESLRVLITNPPPHGDGEQQQQEQQHLPQPLPEQAQLQQQGQQFQKSLSF